MIEESYVSFYTAKLLKEAGFEEKVNSCFMYDKYADKDEYEFEGGYALVRKALFDNYNCYENAISQPTQALAAKWLREVHGIHVSSNIFMDYGNDADGNTVDEWTFWSYDLFDSSGRIVENSDDRYDSYEEALEAGIKRGLELIKSNDYERDTEEKD